MVLELKVCYEADKFLDSAKPPLLLYMESRKGMGALVIASYTVKKGLRSGKSKGDG